MVATQSPMKVAINFAYIFSNVTWKPQSEQDFVQVSVSELYFSLLAGNVWTCDLPGCVALTTRLRAAHAREKRQYVPRYDVLVHDMLNQ